MTNRDVQLIPAPKQLHGSGEMMSVGAHICCMHDPWRQIVPVAMKMVQKIHGIALEEGDGGLCIVCDPTLEAGSYRLSCDQNLILWAKDYEGVRYGIATYLQLLQQMHGILMFPQVEIFDRGDKEHRGFMVDLARWWHPKRTILAYLDLCVFYKIKYMHLHFADNQSYTLPSDDS